MKVKNKREKQCYSAVKNVINTGLARENGFGQKKGNPKSAVRNVSFIYPVMKELPEVEV